MSVSKSITIPYISDRMVQILGKKVRPIVTVEGKKHYLGGYTVQEMKNTSFSFTTNHGDHLMEAVDDTKIEYLGEAYTLHAWGAPSFFKPSIAEVLAQIPKQYREATVAFETFLEPYPSNKEFVSKAFNKGFHVALTRFYGTKK